MLNFDHNHLTLKPTDIKSHFFSVMYAIYQHEKNAFDVIERNRSLIPKIWSQGSCLLNLKYYSVFYIPDRQLENFFLSFIYFLFWFGFGLFWFRFFCCLLLVLVWVLWSFVGVLGFFVVHFFVCFVNPQNRCRLPRSPNCTVVKEIEVWLFISLLSNANQTEYLWGFAKPCLYNCERMCKCRPLTQQRPSWYAETIPWHKKQIIRPGRNLWVMDFLGCLQLLPVPADWKGGRHPGPLGSFTVTLVGWRSLLFQSQDFSPPGISDSRLLTTRWYWR